MTSKATLKAMREMCGLSQQDVADEVSVTVRSVKRWENPEAPQLPPEDVVEFISHAFKLHFDAINQTLEVVKDFDKAVDIQLTVYRNQAQYDAVGRDNGLYTVANANTYAVAQALINQGFSVSFAYPDELENVYHNHN